MPGIKHAAVRKLQHELGIPASQVRALQSVTHHAQGGRGRAVVGVSCGRACTAGRQELTPSCRPPRSVAPFFFSFAAVLHSSARQSRSLWRACPHDRAATLVPRLNAPNNLLAAHAAAPGRLPLPHAPALLRGGHAHMGAAGGVGGARGRLCAVHQVSVGRAHACLRS